MRIVPLVITFVCMLSGTFAGLYLAGCVTKPFWPDKRASSRFPSTSSHQPLDFGFENVEYDWTRVGDPLTEEKRLITRWREKGAAFNQAALEFRGDSVEAGYRDLADQCFDHAAELAALVSATEHVKAAESSR